MSTADTIHSPFSQSPPNTTTTTHLATIFERLRTYPFSTDRDFLTGLASIISQQFPEPSPSGAELRRQQDTILQAQCYYFCRKFNLAPIDIDSYRAWLASRLSTTSTASSSDTAQTTYINGDNTPAIPTSAHYERQRRLSTTNPAQVTSSSSSTPLNPSVASTTLPAPISDLDHPTRHPTQPTTAQLSPSPTPSYPPNFASLIDLIISNQPIPDIQTYSDDLNPLSTAALHAKTPVPIRRKPWELVNDDSVTSVQDVGVRTGIATDGIKASVSAVPVAGATADEGGQQQPSDATNIIKTPTTLEEKADTQMSEEEQQGQKSEGSRRLDQSTFRSDGRPTWYDDIGVPLFNDDHNRTDSTSPEIEGDVPQAREDQSLDEAPRSILAAGL